jgi:hypothetical protein
VSSGDDRDGDASGGGVAVRPVMRGLLGGYCLLVLFLLLYSIVTLLGEPADGGSVSLFGCAIGLPPEARVLLLVALAGGLGASIHVATSFAAFVGLAQLGGTWMWWYVLRPPIGSALGVLLYFILRGILFSGSAGLEDLSLYGVLAFSGLAGMFSKQAIEWMRRVFDQMFARVSHLEKPGDSSDGTGTGTA